MCPGLRMCPAPGSARRCEWVPQGAALPSTQRHLACGVGGECDIAEPHRAAQCRAGSDWAGCSGGLVMWCGVAAGRRSHCAAALHCNVVWCEDANALLRCAGRGGAPSWPQGPAAPAPRRPRTWTAGAPGRPQACQSCARCGAAAGGGCHGGRCSRRWRRTRGGPCSPASQHQRGGRSEQAPSQPRPPAQRLSGRVNKQVMQDRVAGRAGAPVDRRQALHVLPQGRQLVQLHEVGHGGALATVDGVLSVVCHAQQADSGSANNKQASFKVGWGQAAAEAAGAGGLAGWLPLAVRHAPRLCRKV